MKKIFSLWLPLLAALCLLLCLAACSGSGDTAETDTDAGEAASGSPAGSSDTADTGAGDEAGTEAETAGEAVRAGGKVRVVSYNLDANLSTVSSRSKGMIAILQGLDPDSFGVQECRPAWLSVLERKMPEYSHIGLSADGENPNENTFGTYIFYKTDKYNVIDSGTFWLSPTPDVPSMYGPTVDCNRTCCWVILEDRETGFRYVHMNSHLDWMDTAATDYQMDLIRGQIEVFEAMGLPVFATGDYNTDEGSSTYKRMLKSSVIADAKYVAGISMNIGTYPDYDRYDVSKTKPIDFCFVTKNTMTVNRYRVVNDKYEDKYVSDHFGLCIDATVPSLPDLYVTAPAPVMNGELSVTEINSNRFVLSFSAATASVAPVDGYHIVITTESGVTVYDSTLSANRISPKPHTTFSGGISGLTAQTLYKVSVTAVDLFGKESEPLTAEVTTASPAASETVNAADIFDLFLDNTWRDISGAALEITKTGKASIEERDGRKALVFGGGNLKVPGIRDYYTALGQGFTMELDVELGEVNTFNSLFSNMHAGGFGFEVQNGTLEFALYCDYDYQSVTVPVVSGERLHLVAVYDGRVLTLYVNGVLQDRKTVGQVSSFATADGAKYLCLGADSDATGAGEYPTDAVIYLARIWSYPVTDGQAVYLYTEARR